jgi:predicted GH43/DUF377 family glycosyl hydrolase
MSRSWRTILFLLAMFSVRLLCGEVAAPIHPKVYFSDTTRIGRPFAKDPSVIEFHGKYFMYYSLPPKPATADRGHGEQSGYGIGIAVSRDLLHWKKAGELTPTQPVEQNGIVAPGARVIRGQVHLFYQTYGHGAMDAICHATSSDGVHFTHDPSNPIYHPTHMPWSVGRAIDAEVYLNDAAGKIYLYFATRDPSMTRQLLGMAEADLSSDFSAGKWIDVTTDGPLLAPELSWEGLCIEAPSVTRHGAKLYMFYAGAYNNSPQQIGLATSDDGIHWTRFSQKPFFAERGAGNVELFRIGTSRSDHYTWQNLPLLSG